MVEPQSLTLAALARERGVEAEGVDEGGCGDDDDDDDDGCVDDDGGGE